MSLYEHGSPVGPCSFEVEDMTSFTITDVGNLLGIERLSGGDDASYNVVCPFCGDRRGKCNFVVYKDGELANVYHCFHCDAAGNMLTLYVELTGLYGSDCYKKAYHEIQKKLDLGAGEQMEKRLEIQCQKKKQKESLAKPVDYKRRDHTYRELLTLLQLSPQHRKDLLSRGLTETEVANMEALGYKSTCAEESVAIARKLLKRGCRLEGVPGFFMNYHGDWEIAFYQKNNGYLCPVRCGVMRDCSLRSRSVWMYLIRNGNMYGSAVRRWKRDVPLEVR